MKKLNIEEVKKIELEILKHIDSFCKDNDIEYFINYGTLLGAVRHKGFIPWDDDIDIMMTRSNYDKFLKVYKNQNSKYKVISLKNNKEYFNNFIKIHDSDTVITYNNLRRKYNSGIFIDIFPLDYFENKKIINISYILESLKFISYSTKDRVLYKGEKFKNFYRILLWYILKPINPKFFAILIDKFVRKYSSKNPKFAAFIISNAKEKDILPLNTGSKLINMEFEGMMFPAPSNYNEVLTHLYGDYMTPIDKEQQTNHNFEAYYNIPEKINNK